MAHKGTQIQVPQQFFFAMVDFDNLDEMKEWKHKIEEEAKKWTS